MKHTKTKWYLHFNGEQTHIVQTSSPLLQLRGMVVELTAEQAAQALSLILARKQEREANTTEVDEEE